MPPFLFKTRFAPSPTGYLHVGHALSAWCAWEDAEGHDQNFILRIEDIDQTRCKPEYESAIIEDLKWLGIKWAQPIRRQSEHFADYQQTLDHLTQQGLLYPCFCTRKDIEEEISSINAAPHGLEGLVYPKTCAHLSSGEREEKISSGKPYALRLNMAESLRRIPASRLIWHDRIKGKQEPTANLLTTTLGDVVLARKDTPSSYHLCVTHDDHLQNISLVTRCQDLFFATHLHRLLQEILGYNVPEYHHHALLTDAQGKRFSKRDNGLTLRELRNKGLEPDQLRHIIMHGNISEILV
ncbi:MAG: tRNA glutamyl-Q(34) synthetase GluQRS [Alphaproteobacteria bacterium CG1_02_46_17]|nr:MAG: tRNA glutamyl-Q(34) synthetase GluQRS [Alphaproteobacteria bacterium CG1_02_46_17]